MMPTLSFTLYAHGSGASVYSLPPESYTSDVLGVCKVLVEGHKDRNYNYVLGTPFFQNFVPTIDYDANTVTFALSVYAS